MLWGSFPGMSSSNEGSPTIHNLYKFTNRLQLLPHLPPSTKSRTRRQPRYFAFRTAKTFRRCTGYGGNRSIGTHTAEQAQAIQQGSEPLTFRTHNMLNSCQIVDDTTIINPSYASKGFYASIRVSDGQANQKLSPEKIQVDIAKLGD